LKKSYPGAVKLLRVMFSWRWRKNSILQKKKLRAGRAAAAQHKVGEGET
jgi:hypothetical protein